MKLGGFVQEIGEIRVWVKVGIRLGKFGCGWVEFNKAG